MWNRKRYANSSQNHVNPKIPKREKKPRFEDSRKVFIKNVPSNVDGEEIKNLFSKYGSIVYQHFIEKKNGSTWLLVFSTDEETERSGEATGHLLGDRHIIVSRHRQFAEPSSRTVFLKHVPLDADEEDLWKIFESCGEIKYIHIERLLAATEYNAEVHFKKKKTVEKALLLNGEILKGKQISVSTQKAEPEDHRDFPVFVNGLTTDVEKDTLLQFFSDCGGIRRVKINRKDENNIHAVVYFNDTVGAQNALECNGRKLKGTSITVAKVEESMIKSDLCNPVYFSGVGPDAKEVDIFLVFQDCGLIHDIKFVQRKPGHLKKGYIEFQNFDSISKAVNLQEVKIKGKTVGVSSDKSIWTEFTVNEKQRISKEEGVDSIKSTEELEEEPALSRKAKRKKKRDAAASDCNN